MGEMSPDQMREALEEAEFNEELYKERLERTLELFKQLKLNSDLEKLARSYEDLARQEEELESEQNSTEQELEQRESTQQQIEQLKEQLDELSQNTSDKNRESIEQLQEISKEELEEIQQDIQELMQELQQQESSSDPQGEQSDQQGERDQEQGEQQEGSGEQNGEEQQQNQQQQPQNLQQKFEKLAEETRNSMQQMQQQQMNINVAGLQYILYSLLNLSIEQEDLVTYASSTENRSQAYIEYARDQKNVEDIFISLSDSLFTLSTEIPQFSNQINEKKLEVERRLTNSLEQMAERNQSRATVATRQALGGINEISFLIANLLEQLQNSSGSGGGSGSMSMQKMMEQMQQMGQSQQQINQQIQDMINDMQGERLSRDQMERLNQLSRQQNRIRQQLEDLRRNGALESGDEIGSEMERMIEDMEETINDLRGGAVDPTLVERQQNILSRMLEAQDAMQEKDKEERREGTTAEEVTNPASPELTLEELEKQIRNRLNDPNFTKYSTDYQRLIEKYFELLKEIQQREIQ
jgi:myosin heavy subunit